MIEPQIIANYFDGNGLPVTLGGDGGDSCATAGNLTVTGEHMPSLSAYVLGEEPVRHVDASKWYGRPGRFSRDQLIALLCGICTDPSRWHWARQKLFKQHLKNGLVLAWNKIRNHQYEEFTEHVLKSTPDVVWNPKAKARDITGPEVWALWIRCYRAWWLWPLLLLFDLETLGGAIHWRFWRKDNVARNHLLVLHVARKIMPTPWSFLSHKITDFRDLKARWAKHCLICGELYSMKGIGE